MLKKIRLELARTAGFPDGSRDCGYEITAPLDSNGHFDPKQWKKHRDECTVRRFWRGLGEQNGHIVHLGEHRWGFSYRPGHDDDEPVFKLEGHVFKPGEYVSVIEHDGPVHTFKVVSVT